MADQHEPGDPVLSLGCINHAAEAVLFERLADDVPAKAESQKHYFEPDLSTANSTGVPLSSPGHRDLTLRCPPTSRRRVK